MKKAYLGIIAAAGIALASGIPVQAHHSFAAIWDEKQEMEITGVLTKVDWINPHSWFHIEVTNDDGTVTTHSFENFPPRMLKGLGFEKKMLTDRIGETVTVHYNPALNGDTKVGYGRVFDFADGTTIVFTGAGTPQGAN